MKLLKIPLLLLTAVVLTACKQESDMLSEDFWAIGFDGKDHYIPLYDSFASNQPIANSSFAHLR